MQDVVDPTPERFNLVTQTIYISVAQTVVLELTCTQ